MNEEKGVVLPQYEVAIDLETMDLVGSKKKMPIILSIGAVAFDATVINTPEEIIDARTAEHLKGSGTAIIDSGFVQASLFYTPVSLHQSMRYGFTHSADTVKWWEKQSYNMLANAAAYDEKLENTLQRFARWLYSIKAKRIWANAPTFDITILRETFDHMGLEIQIDFRAERDFRSVLDFIQMPYDPTPPGYVKHHALFDAAYEAIMVQKMYAERNALKALRTENDVLREHILTLRTELEKYQTHSIKPGVDCEN